MPFVDFHSKVDYAAIFYTTNTPFTNVSSFDPEKPSVVILHPAFLDLSWVDLQLGDSRLDSDYNIIAFDSRTSGRSNCRLSGRHDTWVDAADLALCFQKLHLPPCHILALEASAVYCALRFAVLFSEMCLSLTLVNVPAPVETKWIYKNLDELIHASCFSDDVDTFEQAAFDFVEFMFGSNTDPDLADDLVSYWGKSHPPKDRARIVETTSVYINRTPLNTEVYASITQPVLILQGDKNELCPVRYAEKLSNQMTGVKDKAILYLVKGGGPMMSVAPETASTVNGAFANFLSRLPHHRSDLVPPKVPIGERMEIALQKLSKITGNVDIESLDPLCSLSFASLSPDIVKAQNELLRRYMTDADQALVPAAVEGWSLRRYSERNGVHAKEEGIGKNSLSLISSFTHRKHDDRVQAKSSTRPSETQNGANDPSTKSAFTAATSLDKLMKPQGTALQRLRS